MSEYENWAIDTYNKKKHHQAHYTLLRDSIVELERCWMASAYPDDPSRYTSEAQMYINENGHIIIYPYDYLTISENYPQYHKLELEKYKP